RLVAGRHDEAEAEAPQISEQARRDRPALGDQRTIAGERLRITHRLLERRAAPRGIAHVHAAPSAQRYLSFTAHAADSVLQRLAVASKLGEAAVVDDRSAGAALGGGTQVLDHAVVADAERHHVGRVGQLAQAGVAVEAGGGPIFWIDRIERAGKAD